MTFQVLQDQGRERVVDALADVLRVFQTKYLYHNVFLCNEVRKQHQWIIDENLPNFFIQERAMIHPIVEGCANKQLISAMYATFTHEQMNKLAWNLREQFLSVIARRYGYVIHSRVPWTLVAEGGFIKAGV